MGAGERDDDLRRAADDLEGLLNGHADVEFELEQVEARRRRLFLVGAIAALGAASIAAAVIAIDTVELPAWTGWALLATTAVFLLDAVTQERTLSRVTRAATHHRDRGSELASAVEDLQALAEMSRRMTATLLPEEIYDVVVESAAQLLAANSVTLRLRVREMLAVASSTGVGAVSVGTTTALADARAAAVLLRGEALRQDGDRWLAVPVTVGDRHVGVLEVGRAPAAEPFGDRAALLAQLFAAQAATAFVNANRYDLQRSRNEELIAARQEHTGAVADTVHDLRAPMAGLIGYAQLLRDRFEDLGEATRTEAVEAVCEQADKLVDLIDTVFEAASAEARVATVREPMDVVALIEAARSTVEAAHADASITVDGPAPSPVVLGDGEALERVLTNLLANAVEHGSSDVRVRVSVRRREVRIHVADRGPGIPDDELETLFRRRNGSEQPRGRGLGIVDALVRGMDGRVAVRSQLGVGSVFTVRLPVAPRD